MKLTHETGEITAKVHIITVHSERIMFGILERKWWARFIVYRILGVSIVYVAG